MSYKKHSSEGLEGSADASRNARAFSELLDLAEDVYFRREEYRRRLILFICVLATVIAVLLLSISAVIFQVGDLFGSLKMPIILSMAITVMMLYIFGIYQFYLLQKNIKRETSAFEQVMTIVHEILSASIGEFSVLEEAQIRIRLSRLDN